MLLMIAGDTALQEQFDAANLAVALDIPEREVENSLSFWRGAGLLKISRAKVRKEEPPQKEVQPITMQTGLPSYTGQQVEGIMRERRRLGQLLEECQKILDRVFNVSESNMVIALCDTMHLPDDYILLLCSYCVGKSEKGVTMKYVYNTAYRLYEQNILTMQGLEDYIAQEEQTRDFVNYARHLFGIGGRTLTPKEKKFFENWGAMGFSKDIFSYAYELSVDATVELSYPHLNKILENFKKAGVKSLEDAKKVSAERKEELKKLYSGNAAGAENGKKPAKAEKESFMSFDTEEFFEKAIKKSNSKLEHS